MTMASSEDKTTAMLQMDRGLPLGNSIGPDARRRLHVKIAQDPTEPIPFEIAVPSIPTIANVSAPLANTEYSYSFPLNGRKFLIRCRGLAGLQFSFQPTQSATNFMTIKAGGFFVDEGTNLSGVSIYFQLNSPSQVVEILTWSL